MKRLILAAALCSLPTLAAAEHGGQAAGQALESAHHAMMSAMGAVQPTGDPDRDFVLMMIPHHQGAIDMAKVQVEYGHDDDILALAGEIIAAQEKEISMMQEWLGTNP